MLNDTLDDIMNENPTLGKKAKPNKPARKKISADKAPSKVKITKGPPGAPVRTRKRKVKNGADTEGPMPGPTPTTAKAAKTTTKKVGKKVTTIAAKKEPRPTRIASDVSTVQPDDNVVIKAVRKLKEATMASKFSAELGIHRRVIRAQLQRLAKDKSNNIKFVKTGFNWFVTNTAK